MKEFSETENTSITASTISAYLGEVSAPSFKIGHRTCFDV